MTGDRGGKNATVFSVAMRIRSAIFLVLGAFAAVAVSGAVTYLSMGSAKCPHCDSGVLYSSRFTGFEWTLRLFFRFYRCGKCQRRIIKLRTVPVRSAGEANPGRPG
jgi:DNA-directed RNA polymerase subunit RPC12/RpoP